jgi:2-polyprenyl-3-methyl-5-hydroxy-6-metoxy-1,4-benzoquinol methylase
MKNWEVKNMNKCICRFCGNELENTFANLGMSPVSNAYIKRENINKKENFYPLHAYVCANCFLVQLEVYETPEEIFDDYAYFSSYSKTWLKHSYEYADMMISKYGYDTATQVVELASNDGYLLQFFKGRNIPVLGIEPAKNVAKAAREKGIDTICDYFGIKLAEKLLIQGKSADLLIGNNVLAHVPDVNDFVSGMEFLLKPHGIITMEFPHLLRLMQKNQFDTIYHEHFSYFSFITVQKIFKKHKLVIFDVEELQTHGGSLRIYAAHENDTEKTISNNILALIKKEKDAGLDRIESYKAFQEQVELTKRNILELLIELKNQGKQIVGYGAPAKGNTLLNYCGIRGDFLDYTVDASPHKQGLFLPGTHILVYSPDRISQTKPDYLFVLPWNLKDEIVEQTPYIKEWGGRYIIPIPEVTVI